MVDFEQIGDTFEEGFDKVKDFTKKNKVLTIAICGVGAFALYKLFTSKSSQDNEYTSTYAYVPTGYDGYPEMSQSAIPSDSVSEDILAGALSEVTQIIDNMQTENNKKFDTLFESQATLSGEMTSMSYLEEQREKQAILERMEANSEAWHYASDDEKERLHQENVVLGSLLGASFDAGSGTWSQEGESLYNVSVKNKTNTSTAGLTNVGVVETPVSTSTVIAQMKANSEAWHTASETERKKLEAENQQLGSSIGASYNAGSGLWTSSTGSTLYTVDSSTSKKTSSTSTNVKTTNKSSSGSSGSNTSSVVAQMKANSEAWHTASATEKKNLEAKNQELGKSIGASYNSGSGTWSKADGTSLY